jgi:hypothetical protein
MDIGAGGKNIRKKQVPRFQFAKTKHFGLPFSQNVSVLALFLPPSNGHARRRDGLMAQSI